MIWLVFVEIANEENKECPCYRCLDKSLVLPENNPIFCHHHNPLNHTFVMECCKDSDFCNNHLKPKLMPRPQGRLQATSKRGLLHPFLFFYGMDDLISPLASQHDLFSLQHNKHFTFFFLLHFFTWIYLLYIHIDDIFSDGLGWCWRYGF